MSKSGDKETALNALLDQIESAFAVVNPPSTSLCRDILTQRDFEAAFMGDELVNTLRHLYDYEAAEVHYLTPFLMREYLAHYGENWMLNDDLSNYLLKFAHFDDRVDFIRNRYLSFYERFDIGQRKTVCSFLRFLSEYKMDEGFIDDEVVQYWCS